MIGVFKIPLVLKDDWDGLGPTIMPAVDYSQYFHVVTLYQDWEHAIVAMNAEPLGAAVKLGDCAFTAAGVLLLAPETASAVEREARTNMYADADWTLS